MRWIIEWQQENGTWEQILGACTYTETDCKEWLEVLGYSKNPRWRCRQA